MFWNKSNRTGKSILSKLSAHQKTVLWIVLLGIGIILLIWVILQKQSSFGLIGGAFLIFYSLLQLLPDLIKKQGGKKLQEETRAIRNAEEKNGGLLANLSDDYFVLNDVKSPYGTIAHVVIGKDIGVFLIKTEVFSGKVVVDENTLRINDKIPEQDFIAQTLQKTNWLMDEISPIVGSTPWITPVVVFTNALVSPTKPVKGVHIIHKKYLLNTLQRANKHHAVNALIWERKEAIKTRLA